jgi:hypothetical protein
MSAPNDAANQVPPQAAGGQPAAQGGPMDALDKAVSCAADRSGHHVVRVATLQYLRSFIADLVKLKKKDRSTTEKVSI